MKRKLLLALAFGSLVSSNVFSMEIVNGKLLDHKQWTTGNVKAVVKNINADPKKIERLLSQHKDNSHVDINAAARFPFGLMPMILVGQSTLIEGQAEALIFNDTSTVERFVVLNTVCSDDVPLGSQSQIHSITCSNDQSHVMLEPHGYFLLGQYPGMTISYKEAGTYDVSVGITVISDNNEVISYHTDDHKKIYVSAAPKKS